MAKRLNAALLAFVFGFIPLFGWVSVVIVSLVTLRLGAREGAMVLMWAIVPDVVWAALGHPRVLLYGIVMGSLFVYLMAIVLRETASWGKVLEVTALLAGLGVVAVHLFHPDIVQWWMQQYQSYLNEVTKAVQISGDSAYQQSWQQTSAMLQKAGVLKFLAGISTGATVAMALGGNLFNLLLGRLWQSSLYNPGALRKELYSVHIHRIACIVFALCGLALWMKWLWVWDLVPLLLLLFIPSAISLVHVWASKRKHATTCLVIFYILLVVLSPYSVIALMAIALMDAAVDIRQQFKLIT